MRTDFSKNQAAAELGAIRDRRSRQHFLLPTLERLPDRCLLTLNEPEAHLSPPAGLTKSALTDRPRTAGCTRRALIGGLALGLMGSVAALLLAQPEIDPVASLAQPEIDPVPSPANGPLGISWNQFHYLGSFTPPITWDPERRDFGYALAVTAFRPDGDGGRGSIYMTSHVYRNQVAEISIPDQLVDARSGDPLPEARFLREFVDIAGPFMSDEYWARQGPPGWDGSGQKWLSGLVVYQPPGEKAPALYFCVRRYYNASYTNYLSHGRVDLDLSQPADGLWRVADWNNNSTAGYLAAAPQWIADAAFGGDGTPGSGRALLTGASGMAGAAATSVGPAAFAVRPYTADGGVLPPGTDMPATVLVDHPIDHPFIPWTVHGEMLACDVSAAAWITWRGRDALVLFGRHAARDFYGDDPNDACGNYHGRHGSPYQAEVNIYSADQLCAVAAGQIDPWDLVPETTLLDDLIPPGCLDRFGAAFDAASGRLYLAQAQAIRHGGEPYPAVHVFQIR